MNPNFEHHLRLLQRRRCPRCAERVRARAILRGEPCAHCGTPLQVGHPSAHPSERAAQVLAAIGADWHSARVGVYAAVVVATFLSGWVPLLASLVTAGAMLAANVLLVRRPLRWLPPVPRAMARTLSRAWLVALAFLNFAFNALVAPLILAGGLGAVASAVSGALCTYLYVEGSLWLIARAVRNAAEATP